MWCHEWGHNIFQDHHKIRVVAPRTMLAIGGHPASAEFFTDLVKVHTGHNEEGDLLLVGIPQPPSPLHVH